MWGSPLSHSVLNCHFHLASAGLVGILSLFSCRSFDGHAVPPEACLEFASSGHGSHAVDEARAILWPMPSAFLWETFFFFTCRRPFPRTHFSDPGVFLGAFVGDGALAGVFLIGGIFWFFPFTFSWARVFGISCAVFSWKRPIQVLCRHPMEGLHLSLFLKTGILLTFWRLRFLLRCPSLLLLPPPSFRRVPFAGLVLRSSRILLSSPLMMLSRPFVSFIPCHRPCTVLTWSPCVVSPSGLLLPLMLTRCARPSSPSFHFWGRVVWSASL